MSVLDNDVKDDPQVQSGILSSGEKCEACGVFFCSTAMTVYLLGGEPLHLPISVCCRNNRGNLRKKKCKY